jgi:hypothetical protein
LAGPEGEKTDQVTSVVLATADRGDETASGGAPQITFPEEIHDFGTITQGTRLVHHFKVRNTGDAPLQLLRADGH